MPARPGNLTSVTTSEGLATLNQQIREIHIRIDQTLKQIPVHKIVKTSALLNFGTVNANSSVARSVALTGAQQIGAASASPQLSLGNTNLHWMAQIQSSNQITVTLINSTAGNITPNVVKWNLACVI